MDRWMGRVALVTGAAGGMGSALCERLVKYGLKVVGCDLNIEPLQEAASQLKGEKGELFPVKCNLRKEGDILSMFTQIKDKYGGVDICCNVAGLARMAPLLSGNTEQWREILEVNVLGLSICAREAIKSMMDRGVDDGHVVHWCSIVGQMAVGLPDVSMYTASKHAVRALTEELRRELKLKGSNIKISSVSPALVDTSFFENMGGEDAVQLLNPPGTSSLTAEHVTDTAIYILSSPPEVQVHDVLIRPAQSGF